jgi:hypothetical protein
VWAALVAVALVLVLAARPAAFAVLVLAAALGGCGVLAWRRLSACSPTAVARALAVLEAERDGLVAELTRARARALEADQARGHAARAAELARELAGMRAALEGARAAHAGCPVRLAEAERRAEAAEMSAHAAWDAAASDVPRCRFCRRPLDEDGACPRWCDEAPPEPRRRLLADPLSGARPLIGDDS